MAKPNKMTQAKRNRERARQERHEEKREKKAQRSEQKKERDRQLADGVDPDLVGIYPGPQPLPTDE